MARIWAMDTHRLRRPVVEDAAAIHGLISVYDRSVIGFVDSTLDDISDELTEPDFDRDNDGWIAEDPGGRIDGWAWACRTGTGSNVRVEVVVRPGVEGLSGRLWTLVLGRAAEIAAELGHGSVVADIGIYRADDHRRAEAGAHGFEPGTAFHRMRIDFGGPVEEPQPQPGVTLHTCAAGPEGEEVRRQAYRVHQEGFAEHFGFASVDYETWFARREAASTHDWSQLVVARVDGEPAAMVQSTNIFAAEEGCGYVATLAVLPRFRGQGLGRHLLYHAFAGDVARGRVGTILHVDSNNTTPALGLYTSAGMRPVLVIDVWRREYPAVQPA
ncbi:hypothetical protein GCM10009560_72160 [Nonomuraea longicatena]|uniref:N-acetyltransferase domain-containing protein n=2 Tax=Nonomuraea longicatena TaxID=83682 RepID=A0ABN1R4D7_9ACTN